MPVVLIILFSLGFLIGCGPQPYPPSTRGQSPWNLPSGERIHPDEECRDSIQDSNSPFSYNRPWITDRVSYHSMNQKVHGDQPIKNCRIF